MTVAVERLPATVCVPAGLPALSNSVTWYPLIAAPPSVAGGAPATVAAPFGAVATPRFGCPGPVLPSPLPPASPPPGCPYFFRRYPDTGIVRVFSRPALHKPMFTDDLAFGNFLLFARFNHGRPDHPVLDDGHPVPEAWLQAIKATSDRLSVAIDWHLPEGARA